MYSEVAGNQAQFETVQETTYIDDPDLGPPPPVLRTNELEVIAYWRAYNQQNPAHRDETFGYEPKTHEAYATDAHTDYDIALENEELYGLEDLRTLQAYESAILQFKGVIAATEYSIETDTFAEPNYVDLLTYAASLAKLSSAHNLSPYTSIESVGIDRNEQLFKAALVAFDGALSAVGINEPEEKWFPIIALRIDACAQHAKYLNERGRKSQSAAAFLEAMTQIEVVREHTSSVGIMAQVERLISDIQSATDGIESDDAGLADELYKELAHH